MTTRKPRKPAAEASRPFLTGKRVLLRGLRREDMDDYRGWLDNAEATRFMESGWRPTGDADLEALYRISTETDDNVVFVIVDRKSGKAVGVCGLYLIQWVCRRADYRILVGDPAAWNKGLGTEAAELVVGYGFDRLNLETIYLGVNTENKGAVRSYEKAGFVAEGVRRKLIYRNGRYYDVLMMSILREDYYGAAGNSG